MITFEKQLSSSEQFNFRKVDRKSLKDFQIKARNLIWENHKFTDPNVRWEEKKGDFGLLLLIYFNFIKCEPNTRGEH